MRFTKLRALAALTLTVASWSPVRGEQNTNQPSNFDATLLAGSPHLALFTDAKIDAFDYLEASLSVEDKGAKVTWAPFLPLPTYNFWSEARVQLGQKEKNTLVGLSFQYNPLHPRSSRGNNLWKPKSDDPFGVLVAKDTIAERIEAEVQTELTAGASGCIPFPLDFDFDAYVAELPDSNLKAPAGAQLDSFKCGILELTTRIEERQDEVDSKQTGDSKQADLELLTQKKELSSLKKARGALLMLVERSYLAQRTPEEIASLLDKRSRVALLRAEVKVARDAFAADYYENYRLALLQTCRPVVNLSLVETLFQVLGGSDVDADADGLEDNYHTTKSQSLALAFDWHLGNSNSLSVLLSRSRERASAEAGSKAADYNGLGLTWSGVVKVLNEDGYRRSPDFKESLFIPMIAVGLAYELKNCDSPDPNCADGIVRAQALTPFVDLKLSKAAQFRLGLPMTRKDKQGTADTVDSISVVTLFALQLGAPK